jgi:hypothetical protein
MNIYDSDIVVPEKYWKDSVPMSNRFMLDRITKCYEEVEWFPTEVYSPEHF